MARYAIAILLPTSTSPRSQTGIRDGLATVESAEDFSAGPTLDGATLLCKVDVGLPWDRASLFGDNDDNLAPRLGLTLDVGGRHRTEVEASGGPDGSVVGDFFGEK